ncbi:unnamed protein product, partial [marine sediment metagenome]
MTHIDGKNYNIKDVEVQSLEFDSRKVRPGSVFIAIKGETFDGHDYTDEAQKKGAVVIVTQRKVSTTLPQ